MCRIGAKSSFSKSIFSTDTRAHALLEHQIPAVAFFWSQNLHVFFPLTSRLKKYHARDNNPAAMHPLSHHTVTVSIPLHLTAIKASISNTETMGVWGSKEEESNNKEIDQQSQPTNVSLTKEKDPWNDVLSPNKTNDDHALNNGFLSEADRQRMELDKKLQQQVSPGLVPSFQKNLSPSEKQSISDKVPFSSTNLNTPLKYIGSVVDDEQTFQRTSLPPSMATPVSTPVKLSVGTPAPSFVPPTPSCNMCSTLQRQIETLRCSSAIADADRLLAVESAKISLKSRVIDLEKEISENKKRLADKDYQLQLSASVATERDTLVTKNRILQEQLNEVETELRKTSSNDLALEATLHHLEDTLTGIKNELEIHKQAHEVTKQTLELTRSAKLDSDRIIIEQNQQHQKDIAEISDLKYKLTSLQSAAVPGTIMILVFMYSLFL